MKLFLVFAIIIWLLCGLIGSAWQSGFSNMHLKSIAKGPITLVHAINNNPVNVPGPS